MPWRRFYAPTERCDGAVCEESEVQVAHSEGVAPPEQKAFGQSEVKRDDGENM